MKLDKKKSLAASTLGVGKGRIIFNVQRLEEIKSALTRQDIKDLYTSGAISIKGIIGRRVKIRRKNRRREGSVKKKVKGGKREYIILTRKLRRYAKELLSREKISKEQYLKIRQEIRGHSFRSKSHLKERLSSF